MSLILALPFIIQAIVIGVDEYVFHLKRNLPKWERIGHPLDTLTVLICILFILFVPFSEGALKIYILLAIFSCLFITKDEFIHHEHCAPLEQWLHSVLFVNHSMVLAAAGFMWPFLHSGDFSFKVFKFFKDSTFCEVFLILQAVFIFLFMTYQIVYWNVICKPKKK